MTSGFKIAGVSTALFAALTVSALAQSSSESDEQMEQVRQVVCGVRSGQVNREDLAAQDGFWLFNVRGFLYLQGVDVEMHFDPWSTKDDAALEAFRQLPPVEVCGEELTAEQKAEKEGQKAENERRLQIENERAGCGAGEDITQLSLIKSPSPIGETAEAFAAAATERLDGTLCIKNFEGYKYLGSELQVEQLVSGELEFSAMSLAEIERYAPSDDLAIFRVPYIFNDVSAVQHFGTSAAARAMLDDLRSSGLVGLAILPGPMVHLTGPMALTDPADADGLNIHSLVGGDAVTSLGVNPIRLPPSEAKLAMQVGVVKGTEGSLESLATSGLVGKGGVTLTGHIPTVHLLVASAVWWDAQGEETRSSLHSVAQEIAEARMSELEGQTAEARRQLAEAGHAVTELSPAQRDAWRELVAPLVPAFTAKVNSSVVEAARAANAAD